ncbi:MAG: hypothetical protein IJ197_06080 [Bacteroidaceae bacterium]|nr:hypothetical protein [Bacteroidaceae bacterium]
METQIIKPRSYVSCLSQGLSYPLVHFTDILRFTWPAILVSTLLTVAIALYGVTLMMQSSPALFVVALVLELLDILGFSYYLAHVVWQQRRLVELGYIPRVRPWHVWRELVSPFWRSVLCSLVIDVLFVISVVAFSVGLILPPLQLLLWLSPVPLVLLLFLLPVSQHYLFTGDSLSRSFDHFHVRYMGRLLAIVVLSGLVVLLIVALGAMPFGIVSYIDAQSTIGLLTGDAAQLPSYFPWLRLLSIFILQFVALCAFPLMLYPQLFHWGAVTAIEQEREGKEQV